MKCNPSPPTPGTSKTPTDIPRRSQTIRFSAAASSTALVRIMISAQTFFLSFALTRETNHTRAHITKGKSVIQKPSLMIQSPPSYIIPPATDEKNATNGALYTPITTISTTNSDSGRSMRQSGSQISPCSFP